MGSSDSPTISIIVDGIDDHEDGSATIRWTMSQEALVRFASIGLVHVLTKEAEAIIAQHQSATSADPI